MDSGVGDLAWGFTFAFWVVWVQAKVSGSQGPYFSDFLFHGIFSHDCWEKYANQVLPFQDGLEGSPTLRNAQVAHLSFL